MLQSLVFNSHQWLIKRNNSNNSQTQHLWQKNSTSHMVRIHFKPRNHLNWCLLRLTHWTSTTNFIEIARSSQKKHFNTATWKLRKYMPKNQGIRFYLINLTLSTWNDHCFGLRNINYLIPKIFFFSRTVLNIFLKSEDASFFFELKGTCEIVYEIDKKRKEKCDG